MLTIGAWMDWRRKGIPDFFLCIPMPIILIFVHARMEEGRFFHENEMLSAVVNREFIRCWGMNPLGKEIRFDYWQGIKSYHIVGIIEDILTSESDPKVVPCIYLPFDPVDLNWTF